MTEEEEEKQFPKEQYYKIGEFGNGAFGEVWLYMVKETGTFRVLKKIQIQRDPKHSEYFRRECACLQSCSHYAIVKLFSYGTSKHHWLEMEYLPNGALTKFIENWSNFHDDDYYWCKVAIIAYGIAAGLDRLHKHKMIHRDIKPDNIFLNSHHEPKIGDFGFARDYNPAIISYPATYFFAAPEIRNRENSVYESDIFSFGVTLYNMLVGPISNLQIGAVFSQEKMDMSNPFSKIVVGCTKDNYEERTPLSQVMEEIKNISKTFSQENREEFDNYVSKLEGEPEIEQITIDILERLSCAHSSIDYLLGLIYSKDLEPYSKADFRKALISLYTAFDKGDHSQRVIKAVSEIYSHHINEISQDDDLKRIVEIVLKLE